MGIFLEIQKKVKLQKKLIQMASVALNAVCQQSSEKYPYQLENWILPMKNVLKVLKLPNLSEYIQV